MRETTAALLFGLLGVLVVAGSVAVLEFSWRYWLPTLVLLPPAGAIGWTALAARRPLAPLPR